MTKYKLCFELDDKEGGALITPNIHRLKLIVEEQTNMVVTVSKFGMMEEGEVI